MKGLLLSGRRRRLGSDALLLLVVLLCEDGCWHGAAAPCQPVNALLLAAVPVENTAPSVSMLLRCESAAALPPPPPQAPQESYSVFMLLGNDKLPIVVGLGHVNFYMCQVRWWWWSGNSGCPRLYLVVAALRVCACALGPCVVGSACRQDA